uniref:Solute carrier family 15 member 2 n=1 Tax=Scleropages formosus TaxID=113540 RepID=A0A8C9R6P3_SCLFO
VLYLSDSMMENTGKDKPRRSPKLCGTNYPVSIAFIIVNEFCERFSYYGMKALLTLYFKNYLHWDKDLSTAIYHAFSSLCYFTPVLGAIIADSWLGKFKTIIYLSIVYVIGHVIKSIGAIPSVGDNTVHIVLSMAGLVLIALGTGGIKPCVSAFGGDQFEDKHERRKFFSIFYMSINAGSVLSTLITPILRGDVKCFGNDCYALAFGVPAVLMMISLVVFIAGSGLYKKSPPEGNILLSVCGCIGFAVKNRWKRSKHDPKRDHWLNWAEEKYPKRLIEEIKMVLRVLVLYIPLPMFWALFDQQGSRWTLQATRMNLNILLNAFLILVFVPIFDMGVYPLIGLCKINFTPLKKMATGMIFAALAFVAATMVEIDVTKTVVPAPNSGESLLQVFNLMENEVKVQIPGNDLFPDAISSYEDPSEYQRVQLRGTTKNLTVKVTYNEQVHDCALTFHEEKSYSLIIHHGTTSLQCKLVEDFIEKSENGSAYLRFINGHNEGLNISVGGQEFEVAPAYGITPNKSIARGEEVKCISSQMEYIIDLGLLDFGASYSVILKTGIEVFKMEDVHANNVSIAWQVPQYALITAGEVMFSITGLEFSYSQAPANMKSVLQAGWLMTVAFGNVIVLIVAEGAELQQWAEFVLFAALLVAVCIIFSIIAYFYTYVNPKQLDNMFQDDSKEDNLKKETVQDLALIPVFRNTMM